MNVILFGGSGMVGQGALRECLRDAEVEKVLAIVRAPLGAADPKVKEVVVDDVADLSSVDGELASYDACLFCLGISAAGMSEAAYRKITYDLTLGIARTLVAKNPKMTFLYVSGEGTDSTEKGRSMWARVKGATENALLALPFARAVMFRPGFIQPMNGIKPKTPAYRAAYAVLAPMYPVWKRLFPSKVTTSEVVGRAMVRVAKHGSDGRILDTVAINAIGA
jgi:uncharacterized protein YbjT (DUF2867 family)